jgi:hypothetical protein
MYNQEHTPGGVTIINTNSVTNTSNVFKLSGVCRKYMKRQVSKYLNSLTAMVSYMRPLFFELRNCLITFRIFVRCQHLIARNVANGFLLNRGISHCYEACCIDDVSRGSLSGPKIR